VRKLLELPEAEEGAVGREVIRGVVAIAETGEEKLRLGALETLGELSK
jgi:hypothetical protein